MDNLKKILIIIICIVVVILFLGGLKLRFNKGDETIITTSTLKKAVDIADLSTSEFTYNGIAVIYEDKDKKDVKCRVKYFSKVKAGIDMSKIEFKQDDKKKTVTPILPEIKITSNIVDEKKLSFMPEDVDVELNEVLSACKKDALKEAKKANRLYELSEENLKDIVEALTLPLLENDGYRIVWD